MNVLYDSSAVTFGVASWSGVAGTYQKAIEPLYTLGTTLMQQDEWGNQLSRHRSSAVPFQLVVRPSPAIKYPSIN